MRGLVMLRAGRLGSWHPAWSGLASLVGAGWRVGRARLIRQVQAAPDEGERDEARGQADEQHGLVRVRVRVRPMSSTAWLGLGLGLGLG